jgi:hypothetical protein
LKLSRGFENDILVVVFGAGMIIMSQLDGKILSNQVCTFGINQNTIMRMLLMIISNNYLAYRDRRAGIRQRPKGLAEEAKAERDYKGGALISFFLMNE